MKFYAKFFLLFSLCCTFIFTQSNIIGQNASASSGERQMLVPGGDVIGIKLYSNGVLVVDTEENAKQTGILINDVISFVNNTKIDSIEGFMDVIKNNGGNSVDLKINRENETIDITVIPKYIKDSNKYSLGIWVRDSAAGIGTLTYYNPGTNDFGALGHSVSDIDTRKLLVSNEGLMLRASVFGVTKSVKGLPGQLKAYFVDEDFPIGDIYKNCEFGILGKSSILKDRDKLPVAFSSEVTLGDASILSTIDKNTIKEYSVSILKISQNIVDSKKSLIVKITDKELLEKTGGIVQGMSGSPILQNGRIVGALTHVFVNDPSRGYGIFVENMLNQAENR